MEIASRLAWCMLALIHVPPAAVVFSPSLLGRLYNVDAGGDIGVLLIHRGALFLALALLCLFAAFDSNIRRAASLVTAISVLGFLVVYIRAGAPGGALRNIAIGDLVALLPLALVLWTAWRADMG